MQEDGATDAELWLSCRKGSLDALGQLFERHHARVYRYCLRLVFVADDAEDCLSETYLEAWRARRSFQVRDSALPVLLAVAKRIVQKRQRADVRRHSLVAATRGPAPARGGRRGRRRGAGARHGGAARLAGRRHPVAELTATVTSTTS